MQSIQLYKKSIYGLWSSHRPPASVEVNEFINQLLSKLNSFLRFNDCDLGILRPLKEDGPGICENFPGGYRCYCPAGFDGDGRYNATGHGTGCKDIDECATNPCQPNAVSIRLSNDYIDNYTGVRQ